MTCVDPIRLLAWGLLDFGWDRQTYRPSHTAVVLEEQPMAKGKKAPGSTHWVREVKTVSTFPPEGTFTKDARTIAAIMASKEVSPKGIGSGIRMIPYFINRAGKNLPPERKNELEEAKRILRAKAQAEK
jgi:tRNA(adenine34) deaminase